MSPTKSGQRAEPYGSARDLPSYQELARQIQGGKLLTRFIARNQRSRFLEIERQLDHLVDVVDRFYDRLGSRNWIFHELLPISNVEAILDQAATPQEAEEGLIGIYREADKLAFWTRWFYGVEGLREPSHQIERAREHYFADQYDSAALHLIAVMDGFVNDFEPDRRRGLASRDPDDMTAWNSVVGHHLGLTNALKAYKKTVKKRVDEEVYELHRHGIVHGAITQFDNVVVATKVWNMLFAVVDWATASKKVRQPEPANTSFREVLRQMASNRKIKKELETWKPSRLSVSDVSFKDHEIYTLTVQFLTGWRERNFGAFALLPSNRLDKPDTTIGQTAGRLRDVFEGFTLSEFRVTDLENTAPAIWLSRSEATVNELPGAFECRWTLAESDGGFGYGSDSAHWRLVFCDPTVWRRASG